MERLSVLGLTIFIIVSIGVFLWWLLVTTEGTYLGRRIVVWLYDIYAWRYDSIKNYEAVWEAATLARPMLRALLDVPQPLILDVATGTGRLPLIMLTQPNFEGEIIGLDYSRKMLTKAAEKLRPLADRATLIYQDAQTLPFDDDTFDAVTCLEALEFMPNPDQVIREIIRVARPGAIILLTNRKGFDGKLMPGKVIPLQKFMDRLRMDFGLEKVRSDVWQMDYDQVWAVKPGKLVPASDHQIETILRCPRCKKRAFVRVDSILCCDHCNKQLAVSADQIINYAS
jgi:ubiquinone/menaquinone biosynthesis C-methylase UbiE